MVKVGNIVEEKVSFVVYLKSERKKKKLINAYKLYLLILALIFAVFNLFLIRDSYSNLIIILLSVLGGMELINLLIEGIKYLIIKPRYIGGLCPCCNKYIKIINNQERELFKKKCPVCNGKIEVEVLR